MMQLNSNRPKPIDKETFIQQYVLNRALIVDNLDGELSAKRAIRVWNIIKENVK